MASRSVVSHRSSNNMLTPIVIFSSPPEAAGWVGCAAGAAQDAKSATIAMLTRNIFNFLTDMGSSPFPLLRVFFGNLGPFVYLYFFDIQPPFLSLPLAWMAKSKLKNRKSASELAGVGNTARASGARVQNREQGDKIFKANSLFMMIH